MDAHWTWYVDISSPFLFDSSVPTSGYVWGKITSLRRIRLVYWLIFQREFVTFFTYVFFSLIRNIQICKYYIYILYTPVNIIYIYNGTCSHIYIYGCVGIYIYIVADMLWYIYNITTLAASMSALSFGRWLSCDMVLLWLSQNGPEYIYI